MSRQQQSQFVLSTLRLCCSSETNSNILFNAVRQVLIPTEFPNVHRIQPRTLSRTADFAKRTLIKPIPVKLIPEPRINSQFRLIIDQRISVRYPRSVRKILNFDLSLQCTSQTNRKAKERLHFEVGNKKIRISVFCQRPVIPEVHFDLVSMIETAHYIRILSLKLRLRTSHGIRACRRSELGYFRFQPLNSSFKLCGVI